MSARRRNGLILLLVAGLIAASAVAIATKKTRLGLDLKGGVELIYQGEPTPQSQVTPAALDRAVTIMRARVDKLGVSEPEIQRYGGNQLDVALPDVKNAQRAEQQVGKTAQLFFYDWEANVIGPDAKPDPTSGAVTGDPNAPGTLGSMSQYQAVELAAKRPPIYNPTRTANTQYYLVDDATHTVLRGPEASRADLFAEQGQPPGTRVVTVNPGTVVVQAVRPSTLSQSAPWDHYYVLNDAPALSGTDITDPKQTFDNSPGGTGAPIVSFNFTSKGRTAFQQVTKTIAQRGASLQLPGTPASAVFQHFAIVLDNQLVSVPYIDFTANPNGIDGTNGADIQGGFTIQSAQDLANLLQLGALPIKLKLISQSQVSATLGKQALHQGLIAGLVGLGVVVLFLLTFYRVLGLIATGGLVIYAVYFFALIKLVPVTLTLPGIAGLILTIGVAADANIVIFERVKEEIRGGRSIPAGIAAGYKKGLSAIIDANVVTLMTAFILFILATAGVKGFAFTLGIGTLVSLFTAVMATQAFLGSMGRTRLVSSPALLGAGPQRRRWRFDFMGASRWFFTLSGCILAIGALSIGGRGLHFGIDFTSGTRITTALSHPASESQVRSVMSQAGYPDASVQKVVNRQLGPNAYQISSAKLGPGAVQSVRQRLDQRFGTVNFSNQSIGPTFGQTVANKAIIAIIASLVVITAYIALRFEWKYAVPVLIALMHDVLITAGVYSLTGRQVTTSTVAALLTILGYSLYDTIIVFDRVRENVPRMPRAAFSQIVNRSMSEVLTRSLATSFCTLLPIIALLIFGGATLQDFAFALLVGVASGAYSSIFIASPVLTHWKEREPIYARRRERIMREAGGLVPAYAVATIAGAPADVEPPARPARRRRATLADVPEEVSEEEFQQLVRELDIEQPASGGAPDELQAPDAVRAPQGNGARRRRERRVLTRGGQLPGEAPPSAGPSTPMPRAPEPSPPEPREPSSPADPQDGAARAKRERSRRARHRRHGRPR